MKMAEHISMLILNLVVMTDVRPGSEQQLLTLNLLEEQEIQHQGAHNRWKQLSRHLYPAHEQDQLANHHMEQSA